MNIYLKLLLCIICIPVASRMFSQNLQTDVSLIQNKDYSVTLGDHNHRSNPLINNKEAIKFKHRSSIAKYNPLSLTATALMLLYQHIISPQFSKHCLYQRSCSNYSKAAITEFGLIKGVFLSVDRIMRCNITAIMDIPSEKFDDLGYAIDEPELYHIRKE